MNVFRRVQASDIIFCFFLELLGKKRVGDLSYDTADPEKRTSVVVSLLLLLLLLFVVVVVVVVFLTLLTARIIKSVVTGQGPVTLAVRNTPGKNTHKPKKGGTLIVFITGDAIHASTRNVSYRDIL